MRNNKFLAMNLTVLCFLALACGAGTDNRLEVVLTDVSSTASASVETLAVPVSLIAVANESAIDSSPAAPYAEMERPMITYLENVIPPCTATVGSELEPCVPGVPPILEPASSAGSLPGWLYFGIPSFTGMLLGEFDEYHPTWAPHIVIRGTVVPDTNRCGLYSKEFFDYFRDSVDVDSYDSFYLNSSTYFCFVEVRVNEYIVGDGPPELTVIMYRYFLDILYPEELPSSEELYTDSSNTISRYEGKEMIMFLGPIDTQAVEAWDILTYKRGWWFVQRKNGEPPRAVAWSIDRATTDELRSQLDLPLDELVRQIKEAAEERLVLTGGRIGVDPSLPMLVTDANKLQDFYQQTGAVYEGEGATVLPPPVPGDEDLDQSPTRTGEGQPDQNPPVPGEEETGPPPTDDATTTSTSTTQPQAEETTTTVAAGPEAESSTTSTGTTRPQVEDTTTTSAATPSDDGTTTTGTTRPQAEEAATTTSTVQPAVDSGATTVPAVDVETTQPQSETTSTTGTTQLPDEGTTTLPQTEDTIPTPASTTRPSAEGNAPSDAPAPGSA